MRKKSLTIYSFLLLFFFLLAARGFASESIVIATGEYSPFTSRDAYKGGFINHIIAEAFQDQGVDVQFTYLPWKRALEMTRRGKYIAISYFACNEERKKDFICSETLREGKYEFVTLKDHPMSDWEKLEDFKGIRMGATRGYTYTKEFYKAGEDGVFILDVVTNDETNFKKLFGGRIEFFPIGKVTAYTLLRSKFKPGSIDKIKFLPKPLTVLYETLLFSKTHPDAEKFVQLFNAGVRKIKKEGKLDQYYQDLLNGEYSK